MFMIYNSLLSEIFFNTQNVHYLQFSPSRLSFLKHTNVYYYLFFLLPDYLFLNTQMFITFRSSFLKRTPVYPTPRIALSVGSLVRSSVTEKYRIIDTRIRVKDHRYVYLSFMHASGSRSI